MGRRIAGILTAAIPLALVITALWQRQAVSDWLRLQGYTPSAEIVALADDTEMEGSMRRLFYINHPEIAEKSEFNKYCNTGEKTIVLGCFVDGQGIYILNVSDERLKGIKQVTAAHETLHAAYARLSPKDRVHVDSMVSRAYTELTDQRIKDTIELYRQQDPTVVPNELHSILGTEVRSLPSDLEDYYKRYFKDRLSIVAFSEQYEQAFTERKAQIAAYDVQLKDLKTQIENLQISLKAQQAALEQDKNNLNSLKNSGRLAEYNAAVPGYNTKVNKLNRDIDTLTALIAQYNDIVPKRNAVASEESELVNAIDNREIPQQQ